MAQGGDRIVTWSNLIKAGSLLVAIVVGFWHLENEIKDIVTKTIDQRLESWIEKTNGLSKDVISLQLLCNKNLSYIKSNNYEMKYHEEVVRTLYRNLNNKFPIDFIKPDELRFDDYREEKNN